MPVLVQYIKCQWCGREFHATEEMKKNDMWLDPTTAFTLYSACKKHEDMCSEKPGEDEMAANIYLMEKAAIAGIRAMEAFFSNEAGARILKGKEEDITFIARLNRYASFRVSCIVRKNSVDVEISQF